PAVMEFNQPSAGVKYAHIARVLGVAPAETADSPAARSLVQFIRDLNARVGIPDRLEPLGLARSDLPYVAAEAIPSGSTRANPRPVSESDALAVAEAAW